ncbi:MAG TPA: hypothetical protein VJM31_06410 [Vicinamibacterales bacterium]|nr:hypothetical protein [Vicinamibacterales bacterium]
MQRSYCAILGAVVLLSTSLPVSAINTDVSAADIRRAIGIAVGPKAAGPGFHAPYILPVKDPVVERLEVITEFRRFVLASEAQMALGNWTLARGGTDAKGRTLADLLRKWRGHVSIKVSARFHPQHSYKFMPAIDILIGEPSFLAIDVARTPLMTVSTEGVASMTGAIIETSFNAASFSDRALPVRIVMDGRDLTRAVVDFSRLE